MELAHVAEVPRTERLSCLLLLALRISHDKAVLRAVLKNPPLLVVAIKSYDRAAAAECEVNLIVKSQFGWTSEISYVQPFLYHIRYFHSQI